MPKIKMQVEGLKFVLDKLDSPHLIGGPWKRAMQQALRVMRGEVDKNVPRATGRLAGSITDKLSPQPVPMWGLITANAESAKGVRYPFVLQAGHRPSVRAAGPRVKGGRTLKAARAAGEIILHYKGTKRSTRGWITKGLRKARAEMVGILETAAREIEKRWAS
jgi:hypothetical protein